MLVPVDGSFRQRLMVQTLHSQRRPYWCILVVLLANTHDSVLVEAIVPHVRVPWPLDSNNEVTMDAAAIVAFSRLGCGSLNLT